MWSLHIITPMNGLPDDNNHNGVGFFYDELNCDHVDNFFVESLSINRNIDKWIPSLNLNIIVLIIRKKELFLINHQSTINIEHFEC